MKTPNILKRSNNRSTAAPYRPQPRDACARASNAAQPAVTPTAAPCASTAGPSDVQPARGGSGSDSSLCLQPLGGSVALQNSSKKQKKACYCSVMYCRSNSLLNPSMAFFRIPNDGRRAQEWLEKISHVKSLLKKLLVCEKHFEARYVNRNNEQRKRLFMHAVPTLFLPQAEALECTPDVARPASPVAASPVAASPVAASPVAISPVAVARTKVNQLTTTKVKAKPQRVTETKARQRIKAFVHRGRHPGNSNRHIAEIILLHKRFSDKRAGWKFTDEFKFFALQLYCSNPKTYKTMQPLLCLPTISTLYRYYIPSLSNVCENLIIALKIKVESMTAEQKECAVCIGKTDVKKYLHYSSKEDHVIGFHDVDGTQRLEPASRALVVMVRGLYHNWKQAISYSFLASHQDYDDVRSHILKIISKMFEIGLTVRVLISDVETDFIGLTKKKKITPRAPFFHINRQKVYYMYDPAHLIKNVRDHFTTNNFYFDGKIAKWEHITECYDYDCNKPLRLAPHLSSYHIIHTHLQSEKDKVQLAAEVFSKQTAAAVSACAELKVLDEPAGGTVDWILLMNKLFNMLNFTSYVRNDDTNTLFAGEDAQLEFMNKILTTIEDMRLVDAHRGSDFTISTKIISRLKATLKVILSLAKDLSVIYNKFPTFLSRDCLDLFFDKVHKAHGGLPTCQQVQLLSTSKTPIFNMFQYNTNKGLDCLDSFLREAIEFSSIVMVYERAQPKDINECFECTAGMDLNAVELSAEQPLQQLAAYLLYEGYLQHSGCEATKSYAFQNTNSTTVILTIKSNNQQDNPVVVMVPTEFLEFIESMEITIKLYFETEHQRSILKGLMEHLLSEKVTFSMPCKCFPLHFIKCLYIRYRLNLILNYNNKKYDTPSERCTENFVANWL